MGLPVLKEFFFCLSVRTGALIIGWLFLIHTTFVLFSLNVFAYNFFSLSEAHQTSYLEWLLGKRLMDEGTTISPELQHEAALNAISAVRVAVIVAATLLVIKFLIDLFLLIGIYVKNHYFMLPWLVCQAVACILFFIALAMFLFIGVIVVIHWVGGEEDVDCQRLITVMGSLIINSVVASYIYLTIHTIYRTIKADRQDNSLKKYSKM